MPKPEAHGATFAERAAAARGEDEFTPAPAPGNSSFADRSGQAPEPAAEPEPVTKQVDDDKPAVENKAVAKKSTTRKRPARKSS